MAAITFGLDISHHQDLRLDLAQCRREGIEFVFLKATEGAGFVDSEFGANLAEARAAGLLVGAYHYVRASASAAAQVANIQRVVPRDVPVIPDVEANSGDIPLVRDIVNRLRAAGYSVPLSYIPRWYWQQLGSPDLRGLPPLWSSRYPDNVVGSLADEWADVPAHYWDGYGGLGVAVLQFTSSVRIAGHQPIDANAFRGTRAELAALLGGDDMFEPADKETLHALAWRMKAFLDGGFEVAPDAVPAVVRGENVQVSRTLSASAWRLHDALQLQPATTDGPTPGEELPLVKLLLQLAADVAELKARQTVDIDEAALAAELEARGISGVSAAQLIDILSTLRKAPAPPGGTTT